MTAHGEGYLSSSWYGAMTSRMMSFTLHLSLQAPLLIDPRGTYYSVPAYAEVCNRAINICYGFNTYGGPLFTAESLLVSDKCDDLGAGMSAAAVPGSDTEETLA